MIEEDQAFVTDRLALLERCVAHIEKNRQLVADAERDIEVAKREGDFSRYSDLQIFVENCSRFCEIHDRFRKVTMTELRDLGLIDTPRLRLVKPE